MTIGIEEEFILVNRVSYQYTPSAQKILLKMLFKKLKYFKRSSLEIPKSLNNIAKAFSIVEIKTSPCNDIDTLAEEIISNRSELIDVVEECNLALLPSGLHPLYNPNNCNIENCAALHIHVNRSKNAYFNILANIPELAALTANSPIVNGDFLAMCSRAKYSPSIGIPRNFYERKSDLIINKYFNTIELRICDTQIMAKDAISAAATVECISNFNEDPRVDKSSYIFKRENAITFGKEKLNLAPLHDKLLDIAEENSVKDWVSYFFARKTGAEWQYECFYKYGVFSLLPSLWSSMKRGELVFEKPISTRYINHNTSKDLIYLIPYGPIILINIIKKMQQDDLIHTTPRFGFDPIELNDFDIFNKD